MIAAMSFFAAMTRASSGRSSTRGTTSAARMPRITMTTRTSISVKPRSDAIGRRMRRQAGGCACSHYNRAALRSSPRFPCCRASHRGIARARVRCLRRCGYWWATVQPLPLPHAAVTRFTVKPRRDAALGGARPAAARRASGRLDAGRRWRAGAVSIARSRPATTRSARGRRSPGCSPSSRRATSRRSSFTIVEGWTHARSSRRR